MKILIVGAGAIGGYFGGRLLEKGADVTFLLREKRKHQLDRDGIVIESVHGDMHFRPKTLISGKIAEGPFDVILLSTKAYHFQDAIKSIRTYVSKETMILPLLNGMAHLHHLKEAYGQERVLGGLCFIESTLDANGKVIQTSPIHDLVFGELSGKRTERILKLEEAFKGTKAVFRLSDHIEQEMWYKYLFIATFSGVTSLFRSSIGPIREQEFGQETLEKVLTEAAIIMRGFGAPIDSNLEESLITRFYGLTHTMKSSLQRDMEKQMPIEADHFYGYLLREAKNQGIMAPLLSAIYANLKVYESSMKKD